MQKKIIALAIASALTMPAMAMAAAPTIYGHINMAYELTDTGSSVTGTGVNAAKRNQVSSNYSRIGFKGSEDLGHGLTGMYQMEGLVDTDDGTNHLFKENTFLALGGDFGTVILGNHETPYRMSTRDLDVFQYSIADNRSLMGMHLGIDQNAIFTDMLIYSSPDFSGFNFDAAYVGKTDNTLLAGAGLPASSVVSATSVSANYGMDGWSATLANQVITVDDKAAPTNEGEASGTKLAGTYEMDDFTVGLVYEMLSFKDDTGAETKRDNVYLAGTYKVSDMGTVKLAFTQAGKVDFDGTEIANSGATQVSLGYDHAMTENTTLFASYTSIGNDTAAAYGLTNAGSTGGGQAVAPDDDPSAIAFGIRHTF